MNPGDCLTCDSRNALSILFIADAEVLKVIAATMSPDTVYQAPPSFPAQPNDDHFAMIRPSLPTSQDIRSRIPPHGITPAKLSASYGNMLVGRGLFKHGQRREAFWKFDCQECEERRDTSSKTVIPRSLHGTTNATSLAFGSRHRGSYPTTL